MSQLKVLMSISWNEISLLSPNETFNSLTTSLFDLFLEIIHDICFSFLIFIYCIIMVHGRQQQEAFLSLQDVAHKSELSIEAK
ncbi:hypothetical protein T02_11371 [Trichinella nativa]|uniref:Uncharacterized protein n=1 Tax=Trichinella nativa TaxID=6335 RepID=A0A0V1KKU2_9BILA|nr:hypothetical protein T02_11371 [Trichinella nativa]